MSVEKELGDIEAAKYGFTRAQRRWVKEAYESILGSIFCIFPVWNGEEYEFCGKIDVEIHHVQPRGWCIRVLKINPNIPENAAPLCPEHHRIGQRNKPLTRMDQEVIHLDSASANRKYKKDIKPTSYDRVKDQRYRLCGENVPYWYELWDQYLTDLAEEVISEFKQRNPDYSWPERRRRA